MENNQSSKLLSMTDARVLCYVLLLTNLFFSYALSSVRYSIFSGATLNLFNLRSENGTFNCKLLNFTVFHLLFFFFTKFVSDFFFHQIRITSHKTAIRTEMPCSFQKKKEKKNSKATKQITFDI